jgi:hypothetical protein
MIFSTTFKAAAEENSAQLVDVDEADSGNSATRRPSRRSLRDGLRPVLSDSILTAAARAPLLGWSRGLRPDGRARPPHRKTQHGHTRLGGEPEPASERARKAARESQATRVGAVATGLRDTYKQEVARASRAPPFPRDPA